MKAESNVLYALVIIVCLVIALFGATWLFTLRTDMKIRRSFPPKGKVTEVEGGTIHAQKSGEGPPVVLIHGLSGNLHNFSAMESQLASHYTVYSIDRPGSGHAVRYETTSADFTTQAAMIHEWLTKENITQPLVVGHSMGGAIALTLALHYPEAVRAIALLCPLTAPFSETSGPLKKLYIPRPFLRKLLSKTLATPYRLKTASKNVAQIFAPDAPPEDFALRYGGALSLESNAFYGAANDIASAQRSLYAQYERYRDITCPVGVLFARDDKILAPGRHTKAVTQAIPQALTRVIDNRGHMIPMTDPDSCVTFVMDVDVLTHS